MAVWLVINGKTTFLNAPVTISEIKQKINDLNSSDFYITHNGQILEYGCVAEGCIHVVPRLRGGKGGFGSMLRAIGAQIEKTTNREACRDLSGRRLRDINEEKRLKNWIAQQAEREREAAERRKKKLERLCLEPKHDFTDQNYEKERSELSEKVYDAVEHGFRSASTSSACPKRKSTSQVCDPVKKKKSCLWVDDFNESDLSSLDSSDSEGEVTKPVTVTKSTNKEENSPGSSTKLKENDQEVLIENDKFSEKVSEHNLDLQQSHCETGSASFTMLDSSDSEGEVTKPVTVTKSTNEENSPGSSTKLKENDQEVLIENDKFSEKVSEHNLDLQQSHCETGSASLEDNLPCKTPSAAISTVNE